VPHTQRKIAVDIGIYEDESDPGPYPVPSTLPIEGWPAYYQREPDLDHLTLQDVQRDTIGEGGDRHAIVVDPVNGRLWEFYQMQLVGNRWQASQASFFDLKSNALRPAGWTSADAAGLPILPGLVRYEEVAAGEIRHAIRFTAPATCDGYLYPARHEAGSGSCASLPPMGLRVRLKASVDISGYGTQARVILTALKRYGMILADNGSAWYITGAPDRGWNDDVLHALHGIKGTDFEVVDTTGFVNG
jgi:hypothetical protein